MVVFSVQLAILEKKVSLRMLNKQSATEAAPEAASSADSALAAGLRRVSAVPIERMSQEEALALLANKHDGTN